MHRTSFPTGQISAAFPKALLMHLDAASGPAEADRWLRATHLLRDDLADETRQIPLVAVHDGLVAFAELASREAIADAWRYLIAPENLGIWMRVLRGTSQPREALARVGGGDSEYARTVRWETIRHARAGWWGRAIILHDPQLEEDGLLTLLRVAELKAIPALFGFGPGVVVAEGATGAVGGDLAQGYAVTWEEPSTARAAITGGVAGVAAAAFSFLAPMPTFGASALTVLGGAAGAVLGGGFAREKRSRADGAAQGTRVRVLERNVELREGRDRRAGGDLEGTVVAGQYRIGARMGSGATGVIYEAIRVRDGLPVAVKLLRAAAAHDAIASDRLRREAEALGLAWHPNVVEIIDHGHLPDGTAYLAMELLRGESLALRLRNAGRLSARDTIHIVDQVCEALVAVHAAGIVHRDLKPSNIFLERRPDGSERVKLLDFGIARVEWEETRITNIGAPVGTPGYMSPEQEVGGEVDARSDLFAVGAVLYECLVGEPPPPTPSGLWLSGPEKGQAHRRAQVEGALAELAPGWQPILERALAAVPRDRFPDARAVQQALRDIDLAPAKAQ